MADKINGHDLPKSGLAISMPDADFVRNYARQTVHDRVKTLDTVDFTEWICQFTTKLCELNGVSIEITDKCKVELLVQLMQPWEDNT